MLLKIMEVLSHERRRLDFNPSQGRYTTPALSQPPLRNRRDASFPLNNNNHISFGHSDVVRDCCANVSQQDNVMTKYSRLAMGHSPGRRRGFPWQGLAEQITSFSY